MTQLDPYELEDFSNRWNRRFNAYRLAAGVIAVAMVAGGAACVADPFGIFSVIQALVAALLVVHGASLVAAYAAAPSFMRQPLSLAAGIVSLLLGVLLVAAPSLVTAATLSACAAAMLVLTGAWRIASVRRARELGLGGGSASMAGGVASVVAGVAFAVVPFLAPAVIGTLVGVYLLVGGIALLVDVLSVKRIAM